jgi:uncharacterized protein YegP (UPF0339 family)
VSQYTAEIYEDDAGFWRWRMIAGNGKIISDSGESYYSASNARRALRTAAWAMLVASVRRKQK